MGSRGQDEERCARPVASTDMEILEGKIVISNLTPALWKTNNVANRIACLLADIGIECNVVAFVEDPS